MPSLNADFTHKFLDIQLELPKTIEIVFHNGLRLFIIPHSSGYITAFARKRQIKCKTQKEFYRTHYHEFKQLFRYPALKFQPILFP